jgi:hypothetical protein
VRIDQPDLADAPDSAEVVHYVRTAHDNRESADSNKDTTSEGDEHLDSPPAVSSPAMRIELSMAYRAVVEAAYQEYVIDCGDSTAHTSAADIPTGARGPASRRDFDPDAAGGPIRQLDAQKAEITQEGVAKVAAHLGRFTGGGPLDTPEQGMLDRLTSIASGAMKPTSYDLNFFTHELDEAGRYAKLGYGPESGVDLGSSEMYEVWNDVHTAALEDYGISDALLFHPGLRS